ncbi:MAG: energy coupling factor transporter S component ThiW [Lawsonibacter sp.]
MTNRTNTTRLALMVALAGILTAVGVLGGALSIPVGFTRCCPTQSVINVVAGVFLGPWYSLGMAFCVSLIRNLMGTGTIMAFPGSMCGALLAGLLYQRTHRLWGACLGEIVGTGVVASILAYPIARYFLGKACGLFTYFIPFMTVALTGSVIACVLVYVLKKGGALAAMSRTTQRD